MNIILQIVRYAGSVENVRSGEDILLITNGGGRTQSSENGAASSFLGIASIEFKSIAPGSYNGVTLANVNGGAHEIGHLLGMTDTYTKAFQPSNLMGNTSSTEMTLKLQNEIFTSALTDITFSRQNDSRNVSNHSNQSGMSTLVGKYLPDYHSKSKQERINIHMKLK